MCTVPAPLTGTVRTTDMIGDRIRELRHERGFSVRRLAQLAGVSIGLISQVERGINDPSLQTLRAVAKALDVPVFDLFQAPAAADVAVVRANERVSVGGSPDTLTYQRVSAGSGRLEVLEGFLAPHAASSAEPWSHPSEECVTVLEGRLVAEVADQVHTLETGDSCHFDSRLPHRYVNPAGTPARFLVAITPPSY